MEIKKKELGQDIIVHFDSKNNKLFLEEVKRLAKRFEYKSKQNRLNYSVLFNCRKRPTELVKGWASRVINSKDGVQEVIFLDYDGILKNLMISELNFLQRKYNLSPFYVFKSFETKTSKGEIYGNYLCISITKKDYAEAIEILSRTHCDSSYKVVPTSYPYRTWVLRLGPKFKKKSPEFDMIVGDLNKRYNMPCSQSHLKIIQQIAPQIKYKVRYTNLDKGHNVFLSEYLTASH